MNYAPVRQINTVRHIARSARQIIRNKTGMSIELLLCNPENTLKTPEKMLRVIAISLAMSPDCFRLKTRIRNIAELRFLGALFLRMHFPNVTLYQIAALYGGQDHTSVINGLTRAYDLIHTGDLRFIKKYNTVLNAVNLWLTKEVSDYASATSA